MKIAITFVMAILLFYLEKVVGYFCPILASMLRVA